jgi:signal peptidase I
MVLTNIPCTFALGIWLRADVVAAYYLPSSSMEPTLRAGDRILVNKRNIQSRELQRGDLVVFRVPSNPNQCWIKRIVGLPGDTVEMRGGELLINGVRLARESADDDSGSDAEDTSRAYVEQNGGRRYRVLVGTSDENADFPLLVVPDDSYFMLGDHRGLSHDSRSFGPVSRRELVGLVTWLYAPAGSWERFGEVR